MWLHRRCVVFCSISTSLVLWMWLVGHYDRHPAYKNYHFNNHQTWHAPSSGPPIEPGERGKWPSKWSSVLYVLNSTTCRFGKGEVFANFRLCLHLCVCLSVCLSCSGSNFQKPWPPNFIYITPVLRLTYDLSRWQTNDKIGRFYRTTKKEAGFWVTHDW